MNNRPEVVCLCGSTRFEKHFHQIARRLSLEGKIVLTVHVFRAGENLTVEQESFLDTLHLFKIDMCARVHIVNIDGYMGTGTLRELEYARQLGKLVSFEVVQ